jgi:hypothetical protein
VAESSPLRGIITTAGGCQNAKKKAQIGLSGMFDGDSSTPKAPTVFGLNVSRQHVIVHFDPGSSGNVG